ncbi:acetylornithine transaminase [Bacillus manliponensis]|uniref:acetylornithine transaminase n=1 Tax=Bacillus manliponensis TaxID=574376 RepID=UPI003512CF81
MTTHLFQTYSRRGVEIVKGDGTKVMDRNGKEYLDFTSGIAVCNLGHCHPKLVEAVTKQMKEMWHISNLFPSKLQEEVAAKLTKNEGLDYVFFCNSGAEANEAALKLARKHTGKSVFITFQQSFHGRTFATMSATGQPKVHDGFGPLLPTFLHLPFNDIKALQEAMNEEVAGVMVEVVQGEGGVGLANYDFLKEIERLCNHYGALYIVDEVQTGIGRTGTMFSYEQTGTLPHIVTVAKALGNGIPIGAMIGKSELANTFTAGTHGSTFGGNFLSMTAAKEVLHIIDDSAFLKEVMHKGEYLHNLLQQELQSVDCIYEVRGKGLLIGIQFTCDVTPIVLKLEEKGLLVLQAGTNVLRILPPLTVTEEEMNQAVQIIKSVCNELLFIK